MSGPGFTAVSDWQLERLADCLVVWREWGGPVGEPAELAALQEAEAILAELTKASG